MAFGVCPVKVRKLAPEPTNDNGDVVIQEEDPVAKERKRILKFINKQSKIYAPEYLENCSPLHKQYENSKEFYNQIQNGKVYTYITVYKGNTNQKAADHLKKAISQLKATNLVAEIEELDYNVQTMLKDSGMRSNVLVVFSTPHAAQWLLLLPTFAYWHETTDMAFFV
ncbi:hypothetical protein FRB99_004538 [Tulasnella sp. 403]|nr:hypothetical protein FRB99_004538 [Tulasnella sp. 403]